jgi:hypothetical protein
MMILSLDEQQRRLFVQWQFERPTSYLTEGHETFGADACFH